MSFLNSILLAQAVQYKTSMEFIAKKEYTSVVERRNAIGIWSKKFLIFKDCALFLYESEKDRVGGSPVARFIVTSVSKISDDSLELKGKQDSAVLRFSDCLGWFSLIQQALGTRQRAKGAASNPVVDPRFGLRLVDVPPELVSKFSNLDRAVLYWFSVVKKFGSPSKFTGNMSVDDRVSFCGDKAFYVTKMNGEVTRCAKIQKLKQIFTNVTDEDSEGAFVVLQFSPPEYDVCISSPTVHVLVRSLEAIYLTLSGGVQLPVHPCRQISDVELQLGRPSNFTMTMVLPTTKDQLKKALDEYAKKNGIKFSSEGIVARNVDSSSVDRSTEKNQLPDSCAKSPEADEKRPTTDPMECFLIAVGCHSLFMQLYSQNVDLDILECMDETDLRTYGVTDSRAIERILQGLQNRDVMTKVLEDVGTARKSWAAPSPSKKQNDQPMTVSPAPVPPRPVIVLDSDEEGETVENVAKPKPEIVLDSDDDLDIPLAVKPSPATVAVMLDDDDL